MLNSGKKLIPERIKLNSINNIRLIPGPIKVSMIIYNSVRMYVS